jgi:hypothetical protein
MTEHLWGMTLIPKVVDDNPANIERYVTVSNYRLRGSANRRVAYVSRTGGEAAESP